MSDEMHHLHHLLSQSFGSPRVSVNLSALHDLLYALLLQLDLLHTRWRDAAPGDGLSQSGQLQDPDRPDEETREEVKEGDRQVHTESSVSEEEFQPGTETRGPPGSARRAPRGSQRGLRTRIQSCEDDMVKVMEMIHELRSQREELEELRGHLEASRGAAPLKTTAEKSTGTACSNNAVTPTHSRLSSPLLPADHADTQAAARSPRTSAETVALGTAAGSSRTSAETVALGTAARSPRTSAETVALGTAASSSRTSAETEALGATAGSPRTSAETEDLGAAASSPRTSAETVALGATAGSPRTSAEREPLQVATDPFETPSVLQEKLEQLEARMASLEEGRRVDQSQPAVPVELVDMRELPSVHSGSPGARKPRQTPNQSVTNHQEMPGQEVISQDKGTSSETTHVCAVSDSADFRQLQEEVSDIRRSLQKVEEELMQLRAKHAHCEDSTNQHLQDQLDHLQAVLEASIQPLTSQLSQLQGEKQEETVKKGEQEHGGKAGQGRSAERAMLPPRTDDVDRKLRPLLEHYQQLQDTVHQMNKQQNSKNLQLEQDVQKLILQLQTDIQELYRMAEELEVKKADKNMVESEIKADKSALDSKVSVRQFDVATEQLNAMFHELLDKVTGQEQDWHQVIERLSAEMERKLNKMELDLLKRQLEDRWKDIHLKLQAQAAPEHEDAAVLRKQLVDRFHCLSCDRPINTHTPGPPLLTLPSFPAFPLRNSIRPFTVYALEEVRQQSKNLKPGSSQHRYEVTLSSHGRGQPPRSFAEMRWQIENLETQAQRRRDSGLSAAAGGHHLRLSELTGCNIPPSIRSSGGSHTITTAGQRRAALHHVKSPVQNNTQQPPAASLGVGPSQLWPACPRAPSPPNRRRRHKPSERQAGEPVGGDAELLL